MRYICRFTKSDCTVNHQILLSRLDYYIIRGISNNWFKSYLSNRKKNYFYNGDDSGVAEINCGVPLGSLLGPLVFLFHINDFNQAIKFCKKLLHHFVVRQNKRKL